MVGLSGAAGLVSGWFLPVIAYRFSVPADEPARRQCASCGGSLRPASHCPQCSVRWGPPAWSTALVAGGSCAVVSLVLGARAILPLYLALCVFGTLLGAIDIACKRLPHALVMPAIGVSTLAFTIVALTTGQWSALLRAFLAAAVLGAVYLMLFVVGRGSFGFGDVKLAVLLGLLLGYLSWGTVLLGGLFPPLLNAPVVIVLLVARRVGRRGSVPFGPAMLTGALLAIAVSGWVDVIGRPG